MRISDWSSDVCSSDLVGEECRISDREPSDAELSPAGAFAQFFEDAIFTAPRLLERILDRVRDAMAVGRGPFALRIVERNAPALAFDDQQPAAGMTDQDIGERRSCV